MANVDLRDRVREVAATELPHIVGVEAIADDDDLFDAGMSSLGAVRLVIALEDALDIEIPADILTREAISSISSIIALLAPLTSA